jgi:hypothetical protein
MKLVRATLLPLLSSYAVVVGGIRTLCGTVRALQWAFMGGGGGGERCFFYGPTLPYPTLYHFNLLTFLPSFCTYPSPTLTYRLAIYRVFFFFSFFKKISIL